MINTNLQSNIIVFLVKVCLAYGNKMDANFHAGICYLEIAVR